MAELPGREEVRAVGRGLLLGADGVGVEVAADELAVGVDVEVVHVDPALRRERETARDRRVGRRGEQGRREDLRDLAPPDGRRAVLVPGGGRRPGEADVAAELLLVAVGEVPGQRRGVEELQIDLGAVVHEFRIVRIALGVEEVDLVAPGGAPDPEPVAHQRAADLDAVVLDLVDPVAPVGHALRLVFGGDVVPLEVAVGQVVPGGAVDVVGAALGDEIQLYARRSGGDVAAPGRGLDLLERLEVVVGRGGPECAHVGDRDAVEVPGVLARVRALADVGRLLAALVAADVDPVELHARHRRENDPRIARRRDRLELRLVDDGAGLDLARVEERLLSPHDDVGLDARDPENPARLRVLPDRDLDVGLGDLAEPLQLVLERVDAGAQADETILAAGVRRLGLRRAHARERDADPGQAPALLVGDVADDVARELLRGRERREREHGRQGRDRNPRPPEPGTSGGHHCPLLSAAPHARRLTAEGATRVPRATRARTGRNALGRGRKTRRGGRARGRRGSEQRRFRFSERSPKNVKARDEPEIDDRARPRADEAGDRRDALGRRRDPRRRTPGTWRPAAVQTPTAALARRGFIPPGNFSETQGTSAPSRMPSGRSPASNFLPKTASREIGPAP